MKFGIFDYIDRRNEPLSQTYDERRALIRAAEAAGFYGYHVTEHHVTPLSATPSPSVYLAAVARETTRIRIGALLFLLPLYHPLRLIEELCMLDNLSNGRLHLGVGRGIAPPEFEAYGAQIEDSQEVFDEVFDAPRQTGSFVVGAPDRVRKELLQQAQSCHYNYLVLQLAFGSLGHAQEMRSLQLFRFEVVPALAGIAVGEPAGA